LHPLTHTHTHHQLFIILVALEVLLLCLRALYFCMALKVGALLRMVLTVMRVRRGRRAWCVPMRVFVCAGRQRQHAHGRDAPARA
jgi:hypothetical protein